ncbi:hypothetical protein LIER_09689 [Lithospermum erythrorhizon]|uniref:GAG-pre-integrase domain-containing protein n=1 Tax=Lithospermum erythrorhizon TaxID=34254 RepID=A0AAV3PLG2_LITER
MGLNDEYEAISNQILLMEPLPSISMAYSMITNVESQRTVHNSINECVENTVFQAGVYLGGRVQSCGQRFDKPDKSHLKCDHCMKRGHLKAGCFKLRGYPDWWHGAKDMNLKSKGKFVVNQVSMEEDQDAHMINNVMMTEDFGEDNLLALKQGMNADEHMQVLLNNLVQLGEVLQEPVQVGKSSNACNVLTHFSSSVLFKGCDSWIIDTGASTHICSSMKHLKSSILSNTSVCLPDNTTKSVHSIAQSFYLTHCSCKDLKISKILAVAKEANGLYILDSSFLSFHVNNTNKMRGIDVKQAEPSLVNSLVTGFDSTLWYQRLGHPSDIVIKHMMKVSDSQISNVFESPCLVCPIAKQSRLPFSSSTSFSAEVFHLIHLDLWGPYKTKTMQLVKY